MSTETQEHKDATDPTKTGDEDQHTTSGTDADSGGTDKGGGDDSSTSDDVFDASSYEESFGLPADTLKGVEDAESALKVIREYTDKTLTAGLLSDAVGDKVAAENVEAGKKLDALGAELKASKNPELDVLRAELSDIKESLAVRDKRDFAMQSAEIDSRVDLEIDAWASPKYGTSKSRNFNQAKAMKGLQELVKTHIIGLRAEDKQPPVVEKLLRQVRAFDDDEYKPAPANKNSDAVLGSPGTGSRSAKSDGEPANIHEALMGNSY